MTLVDALLRSVSDQLLHTLTVSPLSRLNTCLCHMITSTQWDDVDYI